MGEILKFEHYSLSFEKKGNLSPILQDVSFSVKEGSLVAIVGRSGSGKTLLLRSILRLPGTMARRSGTILFKGEDLDSKTEKEMREVRGGKIGMIFQDPVASLSPLMKIGKQIVEVACLHRPTLSPLLAREKAERLFDLVGIDRPKMRMNQYPFELSGGQCQRVCIAIALITGPSLLLADEPTTALDVTTARQIMKLFMKIKKELGMTILFVTHNLHLIRDYGDEILMLSGGSITETLTGKDELTNEALYARS